MSSIRVMARMSTRAYNGVMGTTETASAASRDAAATRERLMEAAQHRFARDGYRATTVRGIADEAKVNVSLINRYFGSKEGLFEACVARTATELEPLSPEDAATQVIDRLINLLIKPVDAVEPLLMLLLIRSSGDEEIDAISRRTLEYFTNGMARGIGWDPEDPTTNDLLLRAQIALATAVGLVTLRSSTQTEPVRSATPDELQAALRDALAALLMRT